MGVPPNQSGTACPTVLAMERPLAMMTVAAALAPEALVQVAGNPQAAIRMTQEPQVHRRPTRRRSRTVQRSLRRGLLTHFVELFFSLTLDSFDFVAD